MAFNGWIVGCIASLGVLLTGCDDASPAREQTDASGTSRVRVAATTTMVGDLVGQIGGDRVAVTVVMPAGVDPHSFKPSPADVATLKRAGVVFYNGLHLEGKMVELFEDSLASTAVAVSRDMPRDRLLPWAAGQTGAYDPHVWFDLSLWQYAADTIAQTLADKDPPAAATYAANAAAAKARLAALDDELRAQIGQIPPERRVLLTSHDAYNYFGRAYGIDVRGLQGISTETEAGISAISDAVGFVIDRKIPAIFVESSVSPRTIERVLADCQARGWGVRIGGELYSDALGVAGEHGGSFAVETHEGMIRYNVHTIVEALK